MSTEFVFGVQPIKAMIKANVALTSTEEPAQAALLQQMTGISAEAQRAVQVTRM